MARASKRETVLDAADMLFSRNGFAATGVNQITDVADVASMTLYNNFKNKDALIVAVLERRAVSFLSLLEATVAKAKSPRDALLSMFDAFDAWARADAKRPDGFAGCAFIRAAIEFTASDHPAHVAAANHKRQVIALLEDQAKATGLKTAPARALALQLHILLDGAITQSQVLGDGRSIKRARAMAEALIDAA